MDKLHLGLATIFGMLAFAACIYLDHIRHKDPHFRKKLRKRREELKKCAEESNTVFEVYDSTQIQTLILNEIQTAEEMMNQGKHEEAIHHFAKAISLCSDPDNIIRSLEQTLPRFAYVMLLNVLINCYGNRFENLEMELKKLKDTNPTINLMPVKLSECKIFN